VAEIHSDATLTPSKLELLPDWMARQRWYAAKGRRPRLRKLWSWRLDDPAGEVGIETLLVVDESTREPVVYQVPLTYRGAPIPGGEGALVGTMEHSVLGPRWVYDGPRDPVYAGQLAELVGGRVQAQSGSESDTPEPHVAGHPHPAWHDEVTITGSRVLSGEQSNTSIIYQAHTPDGSPRPLICKVFRTLQSGDNPDVVLQAAIAAAGSRRVPATLGAVTAQWPDPHDQPDRGTGSGGESDQDSDRESHQESDQAAAYGSTAVETPRAYGHLAFAQEFLPGVEDAWRVALRSLSEGLGFATEARELGAATAEVHRTLSTALPTERPTPEVIDRVMRSMEQRHVAATLEVPALVEHEQRINAVFAEARAAAWPDFQRIHGDYHLGQVLSVPGRGWVLLDFEGEPLRPLAERSRPDQPMRDIAGMLRSFDYAGGSREQAHKGQSARPWVEACQAAFLDGYAGWSGVDPRHSPALLAAFQLDKALYEVVYEARNRPTWLSIPTSAINRLLAEPTLAGITARKEALS
jgi:maltokinase